MSDQHIFLTPHTQKPPLTSCWGNCAKDKNQSSDDHVQLLQNLPGNLSSDLNNLKTNLGINLGANLPNRLLPSETTGALLIDLRRAKQVPRKALSTSFVTFPPLCSRLHRTGFGCTSKDKKTALHREGGEGISCCLFDTVTMVTCRLTAPCLGLSVNLLGLSLQPANYKYNGDMPTFCPLPLPVCHSAGP